MKVLFQNEYFVVVDKPAGMLSVPGRFPEKDLRPVVGLILQKELSMKVYPVHRLDYEVSGLLLFAKTSEAHRSANRWFEKKLIHKIYKALTTRSEQSKLNLTTSDFFEWNSKILRGKKRAYESPVGQVAKTRARFLGLENNYFHWELEPVTGRSHQLRYELSKQGFPILGDRLYGSEINYGTNTIALRAVKMIFPLSEIGKWGLPAQIEIPFN